MPDGPTRAAVDRLSYAGLYARWEAAHWRATELDLGVDRRDWEQRFSDFERRAALWNCALFLWGEDAVADNLAPFIDAAPRQEQKYLLATQQADEVRHAMFFTRFLCDVADVGDGTVANGCAAIKSQLPAGFVKTFYLLDRKAEELRADPSPTMLAQAVALYHVVIEAMLAQPGQHFIEAALTRRRVMPGLRAAVGRIALDERRHIALGVKLLRDLATEDPDVPAAVADVLREVLPHSMTAYAPPGFDRRYSTCLGFTLEELFEYAARSFESKLQAAGLPLESLPSPIPYRHDLPPGERARRGVAMVQAATRTNGAVGRNDPARVERLVRSLG